MAHVDLRPLRTVGKPAEAALASLGTLAGGDGDWAAARANPRDWQFVTGALNAPAHVVPVTEMQRI